MKSYLKFLSRNKLYAAIHALGLVVSLAFVIVIACYTWQQLAITRDAPDHKRIYALTGGGEYLSAWPGELAAVQDRIPDIEAAARINSRATSVVFNGLRVPGNPGVLEVDPEFFGFLPQTFVSGNAEVLRDRSQVLLGESFARRISPDGDPVGKSIVIRQDTCVIGGIIRTPERSLLRESDIYRLFSEPDARSATEFIIPLDLILVRLRQGADHQSVRTIVDTVVTREFADMYKVNKPQRRMTVPGAVFPEGRKCPEEGKRNADLCPACGRDPPVALGPVQLYQPERGPGGQTGQGDGHPRHPR